MLDLVAWNPPENRKSEMIKMNPQANSCWTREIFRFPPYSAMLDLVVASNPPENRKSETMKMNCKLILVGSDRNLSLLKYWFDFHRIIANPIEIQQCWIYFPGNLRKTRNQNCKRILTISSWRNQIELIPGEWKFGPMVDYCIIQESEGKKERKYFWGPDEKCKGKWSSW